MQPRTMWDGETLVEAPLDYARDYRAIDAYNASFAASSMGVEA